MECTLNPKDGPLKGGPRKKTRGAKDRYMIDSKEKAAGSAECADPALQKQGRKQEVLHENWYGLPRPPWEPPTRAAHQKVAAA
jgi:hypothetical protein